MKRKLRLEGELEGEIDWQEYLEIRKGWGGLRVSSDSRHEEDTTARFSLSGTRAVVGAYIRTRIAHPLKVFGKEAIGEVGNLVVGVRVEEGRDRQEIALGTRGHERDGQALRVDIGRGELLPRGLIVVGGFDQQGRRVFDMSDGDGSGVISLEGNRKITVYKGGDALGRVTILKRG